jgi:cytochrome c oxidase assembly factor CtaG
MLFQTMTQNGISTTLIVMMILLFILMFALVIFSFIFWILMIIDCAKRKGLSDQERVVWILVLVFLHAIGAAIYYFAVKRK